jgi:hypothetical protein
MAKKIDEAEVKKECPSCGLGVPLDATICEFCGWDFEEEDEWILQIEKLERDLMLEKQRFEPGSVNQKIESTLHTPAEMKTVQIVKEQAQEKVPEAPRASALERVLPQKKRAEAVAEPSVPRAEPEVKRVRTVRQVSAVSGRPAGAGPGEQRKKVRVLKKVKQ